MKNCQTSSNKSGVLEMTAGVMAICAVRSSTVTTGVSYTSDFMWLQKKKSKGLRWSGERGRQAADPSRPIYLPGYVA
ncbi:hypothetical protein TNCV_4890471 [Trichonephila clavipes]|nr:hypothetical protein TNCV_4890471 [Trichonephila clavipes]